MKLVVFLVIKMSRAGPPLPAVCMKLVIHSVEAGPGAALTHRGLSDKLWYSRPGPACILLPTAPESERARHKLKCDNGSSVRVFKCECV